LAWALWKGEQHLLTSAGYHLDHLTKTAVCRALADELRTAADSMRRPDTRADLLMTADSYERAANEAMVDDQDQ
jgi:hypothetical protein